MIRSIYIIGSLRNPRIPEIANTLAAAGIEAFADWYQPGPEADDYWKKYSQARGLSYKDALKSHGANQIFDFDKAHLDRCDAAVMVAPAGKSAHLELGYTIGKGKPGYILFDGEPERWDLMVKFATRVFFSTDDLLYEINEVQNNGANQIRPGSIIEYDGLRVPNGKQQMVVGPIDWKIARP